MEPQHSLKCTKQKRRFCRLLKTSFFSGEIDFEVWVENIHGFFVWRLFTFLKMWSKTVVLRKRNSIGRWYLVSWYCWNWESQLAQYKQVLESEYRWEHIIVDTSFVSMKLNYKSLTQFLLELLKCDGIALLLYNIVQLQMQQCSNLRRRSTIALLPFTRICNRRQMVYKQREMQHEW